MINGRLIGPTQPCLLSTDRGWTLGDGIFETMRVHGGQVLHLHAHLRRLDGGAQVLALELPSPDTLRIMVQQTLAAASLGDAVLRLSVSRGAGERGLSITPRQAPTIMLSAQSLVPYPARWYTQGVTATIASVPRNEHSPLARIKTLSYAEQVLARSEAQRAGVDVALQRNTRGELACADCANLWLVRDQQLITPPVEAGILPGIARSIVLALAIDVGLVPAEAPLTDIDLWNANEALLTNVLLEVAPLVRVDTRTIGTGQPGPFAHRLRAAYCAALGIA